MTDIQWLIGGEAGYGIMTTGVMMAKIFARLGLSVFDYVEYPSLVRGGHNAYYVRGSDVEIFSQKKPIDILVALNRETIDKHKTELSQNAVIIFDPNVAKVEQSEFGQNIILLPVPLLELTAKVGADKLMINTVAVGASLAVFYNDFSVLEKIMQDVFGKKGEKVVLENVNTSKAGFDYVIENYKNISFTKFQSKQQESLLISGAEAVAIGAVKSGLKFAAIYPMTPINGVLANLVSMASKYNLIVKEPEDEISGITMAIGASFAGARSMVASAGGGFSLMVEALGFSSQTEIPLVIVEGMRPGPSSGMPTWTDQGDLRFVLHASQGDFPKIVIAPGDIFDLFTRTLEAFNLAEKYQLPVIILVDKYLMESHSTVQSSKLKVESENFKLERGKILLDQDVESQTDYKRYQLTEDGISPRSLPGQKGGIALSDSYEHNEKGMYDEEVENRIKMMDKRFKKLEFASKEIPLPQLIGNQEALLTIISFGSTKMPILEAIRMLGDGGSKVNYLNVSYLNPFPAETVSSVIKNAKKTLIIEGNKTGQFEGLIREYTGLSVDNNFRKYDGRPFYPEEIAEKIKLILSS
ncbi:2-oxoacid:acceptor oxidoreductase subunit alpha [Candidatus Microgenomates bacterium]|nr:MAG: 2-oxoacid:acceptor oxidoreductase subunit alpha [Candidatus Microgenomates bacterium]